MAGRTTEKGEPPEIDLHFGLAVHTDDVDGPVVVIGALRRTTGGSDTLRGATLGEQLHQRDRLQPIFRSVARTWLVLCER